MAMAMVAIEALCDGGGGDGGGGDAGSGCDGGGGVTVVAVVVLVSGGGGVAVAMIAIEALVCKRCPHLRSISTKTNVKATHKTERVQHVSHFRQLPHQPVFCFTAS